MSRPLPPPPRTAPTRPWVVVVPALALAGAAGVAAAPAAAGADATPATATVRMAHLAPGVAPVQVTLISLSGGTVTLPGTEAYGQSSRYEPLAAGVYTVRARQASAPGAAPLLTWTIDAKAGEAYTVAAVGSGTGVKGTVLRDDLTPPPVGKGSVRFIQGASAAGRAGLSTIGGAVIASPTDFATATGYAPVPAGTWPLTASSVDHPSVQTQGSVSIAAGSVTSVVLLDQPGGGVRLTTTLDAAGTRATPRKGVHTGAGGTAAAVVGRAPTGLPLGLAAAGGSALLALLGARLARRGARVRRAVTM